MKERCKRGEYDSRFLAYKGCSVCEEWNNFEKFEEWYLDNYYLCNNEKLFIDKDLLVSGNKIYSPSTCCLLPRILNNSITKYTAFKHGLPPGVTHGQTLANTYSVNISFGDVKLNKTFKDVSAAFNCYKNEKEKYIKKLASEYKEYIPNHVYVALNEFEITWK